GLGTALDFPEELFIELDLMHVKPSFERPDDCTGILDGPKSNIPERPGLFDCDVDRRPSGIVDRSFL
ncbi:MAG TPA: hypothetical protein VHY37_08575, partial [Tepidisphaeraceae bacterium]|nr:hypothetical protein [Tepidisphaeraceae bacterium]